MFSLQPRILARTREVTRAVVEIKVPVQLSDIQVTLPPETEREKAKRRKITEEEFFAQLQHLNDPKAVEFARWILDNAEDHELKIVWGDSGPLFKYFEPTKGKYFTFGQLHPNGLLGATGWLWGRFVELSLPIEICQDYFDEVANLIPNASRKRFKQKSGNWQWEQIAYGKNPKPGDLPPFAALAENKEKFMEAIDKAIQRINEVMENE